MMDECVPVEVAIPGPVAKGDVARPLALAASEPVPLALQDVKRKTGAELS
jgi:hypothetical protein